MRQNWKKAVITKKIEHTDSICSLFFKSEDDKAFNFIPGQFITLDLPISDQCIKRWRSYSIASSPHDINEEYDFEICISKYQSGAGSLYLYNEVSVGDTLPYKGPAGSFVLDYEEDSILIMICTETGIAPCRSMLRALETNEKTPRKIELIHNVDNVNQLLYRDEMYSYMDTLPKFRYYPNVSGDKYWLMMDIDLPIKIIEKYSDNPEKLRFYICGWPEMVKNTLSLLIHDLSFHQNQIFYQIYR